MHHNNFDALNIIGESRLKRHFLNFLKKDGGRKVRPGALTPSELKELIKSIGNKRIIKDNCPNC